MPETRKRHRGDKIAHKARGMPNEHLGPSSKAQRVGQSGHGLHCEHRPGRLKKPSGADLGRRRGPAVGLSIRQMASTKRLSSSQVHRLLGTEESLKIPWWLSQRRGQEAASLRTTPTSMPALRAEMEALRRCHQGWNAWSAGNWSW